MFEIITPETLQEYEAFIAAHPKGHFMQSSLWAKQKSEWTWAAVAVRDKGGAMAGSLAVLIRRVPGFPYTLMYGCRGPVCDPRDRDTLVYLMEGAKELARRHKAYVLKLDPDIEADHAVFKGYMQDLGFATAQEGKNFEGIQPRFVFRMNIEGKSEQEVLESFQPKTRYNIRLAERKGIRVEIRGHDAMGDFARLMVETGVRDGFVTRPQRYFDNMLDNLGRNARLYMAYYGDIAVAGTLAIQFGDKVWYLYGASANEYRNLMPNYLLQWRMIQWAVETGCRVYDFRGVSGDLDESNPLYGLYRFKKGFNGDFTEFIGEMDLVLHPAVHFMVDKATFLHKKLSKARYMLKNRGKGPQQAAPAGTNGE